MEEILIYLCDIDGTIADLKHRLHYVKGEKKNWDAFFEACGDDAPILSVIQTLRLLKNADARIILVSGRSSAVREHTHVWLGEHDVPYDGLYMRQAGDHRPDDIVKSELLDQILKDYGITEQGITAVFDDRDQVVKMWRKRGLHAFQVAEGNF